MLTPEQQDILADIYITDLYNDLERDVIADIARRVKKTMRYTETAELQADAMRSQGYSSAKIQAEVRKLLNQDPEYTREVAQNTYEYKQDIKQLIKEIEEEARQRGDELVANAGDMAWRDDLRAWEMHGEDLSKPNSLDQIYRSVGKQTRDAFRNITQTTGFKNTALGTTGVMDAYQRELDLATVKLATGTFSREEAVKECVHRLAASGLRSIDYGSGRSYELDTAARMCVRTACAQLGGKIQEANLQQTKTALVYVDAHASARPSHAVWQGKVYAYDSNALLKDGSTAGSKYGDFFSETDYGSPTGLLGINCAHHFYPYWEGDPIPQYTPPADVEINGKTYTYYEATQAMRKREREIRATRRELEATEALGGDTKELAAKLKSMRNEYRAFGEKAGVTPRYSALGVVPGASDLTKTSAWEENRRQMSGAPKMPETKNRHFSAGKGDGDNSEPIKLGEIDISKRDLAIEYYKEQIRNKDVENLVVIAPTGEVYYNTGNKTTVSYGSLNISNSDVLHNHIEVGSFGEDDFLTIRDNPSARYHLVDPKYDYTLEVTGDISRMTTNDLFKASLQYFIDRGEEIESKHAGMMALKENGYIIYDRVPKKES